MNRIILLATFLLLSLSSNSVKAAPVKLTLLNSKTSFTVEIIRADANVVIIKGSLVNGVFDERTGTTSLELSAFDRDSLTGIIAELGRRLKISPKPTPLPPVNPATIPDVTFNRVNVFPEKYVGKTVRIKGEFHGIERDGDKDFYVPKDQQAGLILFGMFDTSGDLAQGFLADKKKFAELLLRLKGGFNGARLEVVADVGSFTFSTGTKRKTYTVRSIKVLK